MAEAAATVDPVECLDDLPGDFLDALHDELGDAVAAVDRVVVLGVGVQQDDLQLATVRGVDEAWGVDDGDAVAQGQAAAGEHEAGVPRRDGHRDARRHERPAPGTGDGGVLPGVQVETGVARVGVGGEREVGVEADDRHRQRHRQEDTEARYVGPVEGAHDLGGLDGFGPVVTDDGELTSHEPWELRAQGVALFAVRGSMRPWIERLDPATYLTSPYYVRWLRAAELGAVTSGVLSQDDLDRWRQRFADDPTAEPPVVHDEERRARIERGMTTPQRLRPASAPAFAAGDRVVVKRWHDPEHHHRCPRYVRGVAGVVETAWGEEPVPGNEDDWAPTYTVSFASGDLWSTSPEAPFTVAVDLCEHYLEQAP